MSAHPRDAIDTYQGALVRAGREQDAAKLLLERLADPSRRGVREAIKKVGRLRAYPFYVGGP